MISVSIVYMCNSEKMKIKQIFFMNKNIIEPLFRFDFGSAFGDTKYSKFHSCADTFNDKILFPLQTMFKYLF